MATLWELNSIRPFGENDIGDYHYCQWAADDESSQLLGIGNFEHSIFQPYLDETWHIQGPVGGIDNTVVQLPADSVVTKSVDLPVQLVKQTPLEASNTEAEMEIKVCFRIGSVT
ncbi:MAG: hypothetical protein CL912_11565 [Deltaproteobacteria bacterium]|nr:hypothetical protein [Deltaproteobacteria bacterium]|tara:strand:+ start:874 stop:1215 length:342 start_codon:yes stop_codon:yes gene_type:complete